MQPESLQGAVVGGVAPEGKAREWTFGIHRWAWARRAGAHGYGQGSGIHAGGGGAGSFQFQGLQPNGETVEIPGWNPGNCVLEMPRPLKGHTKTSVWHPRPPRWGGFAFGWRVPGNHSPPPLLGFRRARRCGLGGFEDGMHRNAVLGRSGGQDGRVMEALRPFGQS